MSIFRQLLKKLDASPKTFHELVMEEITAWGIEGIKYNLFTETRPAGAWFSGTESVSVLGVDDGIHRGLVVAEPVGTGFAVYTRSQLQKPEMHERAKQGRLKVSEEARLWYFGEIVRRAAKSALERLEKQKGGNSHTARILKPLEGLTRPTSQIGQGIVSGRPAWNPLARPISRSPVKPSQSP